MLRRIVSLFTGVVLVVLMAASAFCTVAYAETYPTFELVLSVDENTNTAVLTATLPAGVVSGKIVVDTTSKLTLKAGTLVSSISEYMSEDYDREDVDGLAVAFAKKTAYDEGTVVFTAEYTVNGDVNAVTASDIVVPLWNLSDGSVRLATQANGDVNKTVNVDEFYTVTFVVSTGGSISGETQISVAKGTNVADILPAYTLEAGYGFKAYSVTAGTVTGDMTINVDFYLIGDVNFDGTTDNLDAAFILRYDAQLLTFDADQLCAGDVNFNTLVDSLDASRVLMYDADIIGPFEYVEAE